MARLPKVTIAIPTFNRLAYVRQAIESALAQSYPELEVIVSDNCSRDGTAEAVSALRDARLTVLRQSRNLGMIGNWNACLEHATGEFFLLLSDDDYLEPDAIANLVQAILNAPDPDKVGVSYCRTWVIGPNHELELGPTPRPSEEAREFALGYFEGKRVVYLAGTLVRSSDLRRIGGYTQGSVALAVDAIVFSRILLTRGVIVGVQQPLAYYRVHSASATNTSRVVVWQKDIRALIALWSAGFERSGADRRRFLRAARRYESWQIAILINLSAKSGHGRIYGIATYWACRESFAGVIGKRNWLAGMLMLLAPETLKRPVRTFLLWLRQRNRNKLQKASCWKPESQLRIDP